MSTLGEHTENENPTVTSLKREDTKEQIDGLLQHFDVLPSRFDRFLFKYIYVFLIGLFFLVNSSSFYSFSTLALNFKLKLGEFFWEVYLVR